MKKTNKQTLGEEIANSVSHGVMAIFGIVALILLVVKSSGDSLKVLSSVIFGSSIIILYTMSTLYHALSNKTAKSVFQRFDHLSIYILIGGTYAPFLLLLVKEPLILGLPLGVLFFIIQWILIVIGIVFKSVLIDKYQKLHVFIYLLLGWSALIFVQTLFVIKGAFWLVVLGGVSYSLGVIFYSFPKIKYFHFVWHIFVAIGTILQFIAVYGYVI